MQADKWSHDQKWTGDAKPIADEIRVHMIRKGLQQLDIMDITGLRRQALARRLRGETPWRRWELYALARHWSIKVEDLTGENSEIHTPVTDG